MDIGEGMVFEKRGDILFIVVGYRVDSRFGYIWVSVRISGKLSRFFFIFFKIFMFFLINIKILD